MNPDDVARLIEIWGRGVTLRREPSTDVSVKAFVRGYAPNELVGDITQGDRELKISNSEIAAAAWPGPPVKGDRVIIDARTTTILAVEPLHIGEDIALYVLRVRG